MKLTPRIDISPLVRRNEALAMLGLIQSIDDVGWLEKRWQGAILWDAPYGKKARKAYSLDLIEDMKDELERIKNGAATTVQNPENPAL